LIADRLHRQLDAAQQKVAADYPTMSKERTHDVAVIAGVSSAMLSLKMFKTLPGMPFAPGHKNAVLLPLYIVAAQLTRSRFGATTCGFVMGTGSVLTGDGRYGVFELIKHVVPGVLVDLLYPIVRRISATSIPLYCAFGVVLAAGRFATEVGVAVALAVPGSFYAYLGTAAITHLVAGALSGFVTSAALRSVERIRSDVAQSAAEPP